jgi:hypothetical protein
MLVMVTYMLLLTESYIWCAHYDVSSENEAKKYPIATVETPLKGMASAYAQRRVMSQGRVTVKAAHLSVETRIEMPADTVVHGPVEIKVTAPLQNSKVVTWNLLVEQTIEIMVSAPSIVIVTGPTKSTRYDK